jgi:TorA maturation chaperone TorD
MSREPTTLGPDLELRDDALARHVVARSFAHAFTRPPAPKVEEIPEAAIGGLVAAFELTSGARDVAALVEWSRIGVARREAAWVRVFGLVAGKKCAPFECEWLPWKDDTHRAQHMADVAGFYCAFGISPRAADARRADDLAVELEFIAFLHTKRAHLAAIALPDERAAIVEDALRSFVREHIAPWVPSFAMRLAMQCAARLAEEDSAFTGGERNDVAFLARVADLLGEWALAEARRCGVDRAARTEPDPARDDDREEAPSSCSGCALGEIT